MEECKQVASVLDTYEKEQGQKLNRDKTSLFFSKYTSGEVQNFVKDTFGAQIVQQHEKYLGLPLVVERGKKKAFNYIKDQVGRKIAGWKGKVLSNAGREILIKAVAQTIATYTVNYFKLPDSLCSEINSMAGGFWWGEKDKVKKIAWVSRKNLCKPKAEGGMGFRNLKAFNLVLLAKQGWQIQQNPSSIVHKVLKAKYFTKCSFMDAQLGKNPSYIWRSLLVAEPVVKEGTRWCVSDGRSIKIWEDKWIPSTESGRVISSRPLPKLGEKVANLIVQDKAKQNARLIRSIFLPHEVEAILSITISFLYPMDSQVWSKTTNGIFSVKSAYKVAVKYLLDTNGGDDRLGCSDNSKMEAWKAIWHECKNVLSTKQCLMHRKVLMDDKCDLCGESKSSGHILWGCTIAREAWNKTKFKLDRPNRSPKEFIDVV